MIQKWVQLWNQREAPTVLALIRICVGLVLLWDLGHVALLDLADVLFTPPADGGLPSNLLKREPMPEVYRWFPPVAETGVWTFRVCLASVALWTLGIGTRLTGLVALLSYAQLGLILPLGDRGIDMLLRNVMLLLLFSGSHKTLSVDAWLRTRSFRGDGQAQPAWPRHLIILQLVVMYFSAGAQKTALAWTPFGGYTALYIILQDPHVSRFGDGPWMDTLLPLLRVGTATTHLFEWTAPLMLWAYWLRYTHERGGKLRAFVQKWKPHWFWIVVGVGLHLGIAVTMNLGIFPFAMLALYWAWFSPDELPGWFTGGTEEERAV